MSKKNERTRSAYYTTTFLSSLLLLAVGASAQSTQQHEHDGDVAPHDHPGDTGYGSELVVSEQAREQIDTARAHILANYDTPEKAEAAGWRRPRSSTPTMGEHWTNPSLRRQPGVDPLNPEILMFAPINGELTLVGASWVNAQPPEAPLPQLFDNMDAMWHRHDASDPLNRAGAAAARTTGRGNVTQRASGIVMNHMWFIDAQDGEFTGHNHFMPFMDADLPLPPPAITGDLRAHAALALAEVNNSAFIISTYFEQLTTEAQAEVSALRDQIKALIPEYRSAHAADDTMAMMAILGEMGAYWMDIRTVHSRDLEPAVANLLDVAYGNMSSGHEHGPGGH